MDQGIGRDQRHPFLTRLGDQHAVERVAMMVGQESSGLNVRERNRQENYAGIMDYLLKIVGKSEATEALLDCHLPDGCMAEANLGSIKDSPPGRGGETWVSEREPKERVAIQ